MRFRLTYADVVSELGTAGSASIVAKCYTQSGVVHSQIVLQRAAGAPGSMLVLGGTDTHGYTVLPAGGSYTLLDDFSGTHELAVQWGATVAETTGSTYDIRGIDYRQYAANALIAPASEACILPQAQVENVSR